MTHADKRRAVEMMLADPDWSRWSDAAIAEAAGCSRGLVRRMRASRARALPSIQHTLGRPSDATADAGCLHDPGCLLGPLRKAGLISAAVLEHADDAGLDLDRAAAGEPSRHQVGNLIRQAHDRASDHHSVNPSLVSQETPEAVKSCDHAAVAQTN